ncbi:hypothetical protein L7F22_020325 [Adiantum nelumboides]|nr:hypothetical protein [Adiantum nelumboides]
MSFDRYPMDLNHEWFEDADSLVPSSLQEVDSQIPEDIAGIHRVALGYVGGNTQYSPLSPHQPTRKISSPPVQPTATSPQGPRISILNRGVSSPRAPASARTPTSPAIPPPSSSPAALPVPNFCNRRPSTSTAPSRSTTTPTTTSRATPYTLNLPQSAPRRRSRTNVSADNPSQNKRATWRMQEVFTLLEVKKALEVRLDEGGICIRACDRWQWISENCHTRGVPRTKEQCRSKYERIHSLFTRIRDYERRIPSGCHSYWQMDTMERQQKGLLVEDFSPDLYEKMENLFGDRSNVDVGGLLYDTFDDEVTPLVADEVDEDGTRTPPLMDPEQSHGSNNSEGPAANTMNTDTEQAAGIKRKRCERSNVIEIMEVAESSKKIANLWEIFEEHRQLQAKRSDDLEVARP